MPKLPRLTDMQRTWLHLIAWQLALAVGVITVILLKIYNVPPPSF